jgi:hypothetical protein
MIALLAILFPFLLPLVPILTITSEIISAIKTALEVGKAFETGAMVGAIAAIAPWLIPALEYLGAALFPELSMYHGEIGAHLMFRMEQTLWMQKELNQLYPTLSLVADGIYGPKTKTAVLQYQRDHPPLDVDGWCGPETWKIMYHN